MTKSRPQNFSECNGSGEKWSVADDRHVQERRERERRGRRCHRRACGIAAASLWRMGLLQSRPTPRTAPDHGRRISKPGDDLRSAASCVFYDFDRTITCTREARTCRL